MREMPNKNTVWVLALRRLVTLLDQEPRRLSQEDIHLASFHLSRFVRTAEQSASTSTDAGSKRRTSQ
jgi:hypothetical protein